MCRAAATAIAVTGNATLGAALVAGEGAALVAVFLGRDYIRERLSKTE